MKQQLKKSPWVATRGDDMGRWTIISECRVPEYFTVKATHRRNDDGPGIIKTALPAGKRQHVGPGVVKAVLHVLAAWDKSRESKFFAGNEAIAHSTQLGIGSINNAIAVLKEAGILMKTFQGMFSPRLSVLNWEEIERRREKYKPRPRTSEKPVLS